MSGARHSTALAPIYQRELEALNCRISSYLPASEWTLLPWPIAERAVNRLAPGIKWRITNRQLLTSAEGLSPDVVWLFKGMDIYPRTLRRLRESGAKLVNYNADHPFDFFSRGSGNDNVANSVNEYDLYLTYSQRIERELNKRFPDLMTSVIPFGHDVNHALFQMVQDVEEIRRACFIGNPDKHRATKIKVLSANGVFIDVFGYGWRAFLGNVENVRLCGPVNGLELHRTLKRYRVQLNFFRPHNQDSHNMRTFEVPAVGGIMLAPDSQEHRAFFESGREAFFFSNDEEMIEITKRLLALDSLSAKNIRLRARQRCIEAGYSYSDRAREVFALLQALP